MRVETAARAGLHATRRVLASHAMDAGRALYWARLRHGKDDHTRCSDSESRHNCRRGLGSWTDHWAMECTTKGSIARGFESRFTNCSSDSETSCVKEKASASSYGRQAAEEVRAQDLSEDGRSLIGGLLAFHTRAFVAREGGEGGGGAGEGWGGAQQQQAPMQQQEVKKVKKVAKKKKVAKVDRCRSFAYWHCQYFLVWHKNPCGWRAVERVGGKQLWAISGKQHGLDKYQSKLYVLEALRQMDKGMAAEEAKQFALSRMAQAALDNPYIDIPIAV